MSTIPSSVTEEQFNDHIRPHLNVAKRGYESETPLYEIFNLMLHRLHTGCQWAELPVSKDAKTRQERNEPSGRRCIITGESGVALGAWKRCGRPVSAASKRSWH